MFYNPFVGNSRMNFMQPQNQFTQPQQQQYDFSGWGDRLGKIEEGIAGLTDQFNNFQPQTTEQTQNNMVNTPTNTAPEPLETPVSEPEPLGGIESLAPAQNTGFNFDPQGGSLMSQLSSAYGGQTHEEWGGGRGQPGFTQGFADFFTGEGYYADPRGTYLDGGWNISDKPIDLGPRMGGTLDPYGNMGSAYGKPTSQPGRPNPLLQGPINDIHDTGLLPGAPSGAQLGLPQPNPRGAGGEPLSDYLMFQGHEGEERLAGLFGGLGGGRERPGWTGQPIGGLTQPQQQQALQGGLGALQGPTQQKIQQGYTV